MCKGNPRFTGLPTDTYVMKFLLNANDESKARFSTRSHFGFLRHMKLPIHC